MRPDIEVDARCLLPTVEFIDFVTQRLTEQSLVSWQADCLSRVNTNPSAWLPATGPLPLQIMSYYTLQDDSAYNDETTYIDYRYQLTAQLGSWQQSIEVSTASLYPGNPTSYCRSSLSNQHDDIA